jgi:c-di-AMP phosphodiesterase-like protein
VYVGKTTVSNRFQGGHLAALRLHHHNYANASKTLYRCSVTVLIGDDHVALEWVDPFITAAAILDNVESQLIYKFQPRLNTLKRRQNRAKHKATLHIQNTIDEGRGTFLSEYIIDGAP